MSEVEQVRIALGLDASNFVLMGHSWGGILAMEYALAHQEHLKGLIISNMVASAPEYNRYAQEVLGPQLPPDVLVEIKALVRNTTSLHTPRIKIEGSVKGQNGRVLDECSTYGESMMPSEARLLGASSYFKKSRLSGARVSIRICLFTPSSFDQVMA